MASRPDVCSIDRPEANLFFQFVSRRYERDSIIITSNQRLGAWEVRSTIRPGVSDDKWMVAFG
jgi:DNA replication protein DnaC